MAFIFPGNVVVGPKFRNKLVLLERPNDGTVAMQCGDVDDANFPIIRDYGLMLPNTVSSSHLLMVFILIH